LGVADYFGYFVGGFYFVRGMNYFTAAGDARVFGQQLAQAVFIAENPEKDGVGRAVLKQELVQSSKNSSGGFVAPHCIDSYDFFIRHVGV
jgi:hypothetical protein